MILGILALQGDFEAHARAFESLGVSSRMVTTATGMEGISGLVIPGGESTTMLKLLSPETFEAIERFHNAGGAILGTCAGAVLLAREVVNPPQPSFGFLDAVVKRNGYGRQIQSAIVYRDDPAVSGEAAPEEMIFIRAPVIIERGKNVRVLTRYRGDPVFVEEGRVLATTFHPELSKDRSIHRRFLEKTATVSV